VTLCCGVDMARWHALWEVAADQHGYVTVEQAEEAGVTYDALKQAAWRGHIERPVRGITGSRPAMTLKLSPSCGLVTPRQLCRTTAP